MPQDHRGRLERSQIETNAQMVRWTKAVAIFTAVLAILNVPTLAFVGWQAHTAAQAARETRAQLRAVMQFTGVQSIIGVMEETLTPSYGFFSQFQNLGGTRAEQVTAWQSVTYFEGSVPFNTDLSKPAKDVESASPTTVGANANLGIAPVAVKPAEIEKAVNRQGVIIIWGNLTYRDIYNPDVKRSVSFCQRLSPTPQDSKDGKERVMIFAVSPFRSDCNKSE